MSVRTADMYAVARPGFRIAVQHLSGLVPGMDGNGRRLHRQQTNSCRGSRNAVSGAWNMKLAEMR